MTIEIFGAKISNCKSDLIIDGKSYKNINGSFSIVNGVVISNESGEVIMPDEDKQECKQPLQSK